MTSKLKRGDVWTVSGGAEYTHKPRPAVIVQDDSFEGTLSVTVCIFTSDPSDAPLFRLPIEPTNKNGLRTASRLMVDKISTISKQKLGKKVGRLDDRDIVRLNQAIFVFLGLARGTRRVKPNA
jgi:mRNA interferase MazF